MKDIDNLIGKKFLYISKYGGNTTGIIQSVFTVNHIRRIDYKTYYKSVVNIKSTNNVVYLLDEIYIKL